MLVLGRKPGTGFFVGNSYIRIVSSTRSHVRIGIETDVDVPVVREELLDDYQRAPDGRLTRKGDGDD